MEVTKVPVGKLLDSELFVDSLLNSSPILSNLVVGYNVLAFEMTGGSSFDLEDKLPAPNGLETCNFSKGLDDGIGGNTVAFVHGLVNTGYGFQLLDVWQAMS
jgi:hypothetical protein